MELDQRLIEKYVAAFPREVGRKMELLDEADAAGFLTTLPPRLGAGVLTSVPVLLAARWLGLLTLDRAAEVVVEMERDLAAAVLRSLPPDNRRSVLAALPEKRSRGVKTLLRYAEGTAGSFMDPDIIGFGEDLTVGDTLARMRINASHLTSYVYVIDSVGHLAGVASLRQMMLAESEDTLGAVATPKPWSLTVSAGAAAVAAHPGWERVHALPVLDGRRFVGVLRYHVMRRLERGLMARIAGHQTAATGAALAELFGLGLAGLSGWSIGDAEEAGATAPSSRSKP